MRCLHCGYCCIYLDVMILIDIEKPVEESNVEHKQNNKVCRHLIIEKVNNRFVAKCEIHSYKQYKDTPCDQFTQFSHPSCNCRTGDWMRNSDSEVAKHLQQFLKEAYAVHTATEQTITSI